MTAVAALLAWWLWPSAGASTAPAEPPPPLPGPTAAPAQAAISVLSPAQHVAQEGLGPAAPPVIDEITVEKKEVCQGEENLISIRAHTTDGTDPYLHYLVGAAPGQRVAHRSWLPDDADDEPPPLVVRVFGKGNVATEAPVPAFVVKQCKRPHAALIVARLRANTWSEFDFEAQLRSEQDALPFHPREYRWTFGDGATATTSAPLASHSYEERPQDSMYSQVLVQVEIRGGGDEVVTGRTSLQLINPAYEDFAEKGVVSLLIHLEPRFPELGSDGVVRQGVRLFHLRPQPVHIEKAFVFRHKTGSPDDPKPDEVSPESLLGSSTIPPGRGADLQLALDTKANPDLFSLEYQVEGKDSDGNPVRGAFSIMRPPAVPTRENSNPVVDPQLKAKIVAARKILKTDYVTDEDLWRLEREGKFADLALPPPLDPARPGVNEPAPAASVEPPGPGPTGPSTPPGGETSPTPSPHR